MISLDNYIDKGTFYWVSLLCLIPFCISYYTKTINKNREIFWFIYEGDERKFDYTFLKKLVTQILVDYFAFFTFFNVIYFCISGKWVSDTNFLTARSFIIIGAIGYMIELIGKSNAILHEQKKKKVMITKDDATPIKNDSNSIK